MMRRLAAIVLATGLAISAAACGSSEEPSEPSSPGPASPDRVAVGVIPIIDVAPIYLGKEQGFFSDRNIDLTLQTAQGGAAIIPAVVSGQYQFGFSNVISLLLAQQRGLPVKVVSNGNNSTGDPNRDFGGVLVKDPAITSAADLVGKRVATNTLSNIVDTSVKEMVRQAGGDPSGVDFVEMPFPDMGAALEQDNVEAIFVVEPFFSAGLANGWRPIGTWANVDPNLCVALYFTSTEIADGNPDLVQRFDDAMKESLEYANNNPEEVNRILGTYTQMSDEVRASLILPKWPAEINRDSVQKLNDLAVGDGLMPAPGADLDALLP